MSSIIKEYVEITDKINHIFDHGTPQQRKLLLPDLWERQSKLKRVIYDVCVNIIVGGQFIAGVPEDTWSGFSVVYIDKVVATHSGAIITYTIIYDEPDAFDEGEMEFMIADRFFELDPQTAKEEYLMHALPVDLRNSSDILSVNW